MLTSKRDIIFCLKHHKEEAKERNEDFYSSSQLQQLPPEEELEKQLGGEKAPRGLAGLGRGRNPNSYFGISVQEEPQQSIWSLHIM